MTKPETEIRYGKDGIAVTASASRYDAAPTPWREPTDVERYAAMLETVDAEPRTSEFERFEREQARQRASKPVVHHDAVPEMTDHERNADVLDSADAEPTSFAQFELEQAAARADAAWRKRVARAVAYLTGPVRAKELDATHVVLRSHPALEDTDA